MIISRTIPCVLAGMFATASCPSLLRAVAEGQPLRGAGRAEFEEYPNGTDPTQLVDSTKPENDVTPAHVPARPREPTK